jgi:hypothetical protein
MPTSSLSLFFPSPRSLHCLAFLHFGHSHITTTTTSSPLPFFYSPTSSSNLSSFIPSTPSSSLYFFLLPSYPSANYPRLVEGGSLWTLSLITTRRLPTLDSKSPPAETPCLHHSIIQLTANTKQHYHHVVHHSYRTGYHGHLEGELQWFNPSIQASS